MLGVFTDLVYAGYFLTPLVVYLLLVPQPVFGSSLHRALMTLAMAFEFWILMFTSAAEWIFWDEFGARFNFIAVDYLIYTQEVIDNILESYPVTPLLLGLVAAAFIGAQLYMASPCLQRWQSTTTPLRRRLRMGLPLLLLPIVATFLDLRLADALFAAGNNSWPVPHSGWPRRLAYDGPKLLLAAFGLFLVAGLVWPTLLFRAGLARREAIYLLTSLCAVPLVIGLIKYHSGVSCANELLRYGGSLPDAYGHFTPRRMLASGLSQGCWPSGHASGGFALLALGSLPRTAAARRQLWCIGLVAGSTMGAYQVLRGAHFPSHVIVTAVMAQLLVCVLANLMLPGRTEQVANGFKGGSQRSKIRSARGPTKDLTRTGV